MSRFGTLGPGIRPKLRTWLGNLEADLGLPFILGTWYFVDKTDGVSTNGGKSPTNAFADITTAYSACTSGAGDGICLISRGTSASATTSRITFPLVWSKHGITVVGVSAGARQFNRARISNTEHTTGAITTIAFGTSTTITDSASGFVTAGFAVGDVLRIDTTSNTNDGTAAIVTTVAAGTLTCSASSFTPEDAATAGSTTINSYCAQLIDVTGDNNSFSNVSIVNHSSDAAAIGGVKVQGNRNAFNNVHFIGAGHATPRAVADANDLEINSGQENTFRDCSFGTDSVLAAATNSNVLFDTNCWRNHFDDCEFRTYSKTTTGGAINSKDATSMEGWQFFRGCNFINWNENGLTANDSVFIGTKPTSGYVALDNKCACFGYTAWDDSGANNTFYIASPTSAASGAGGIATTI